MENWSQFSGISELLNVFHFVCLSIGPRKVAHFNNKAKQITHFQFPKQKQCTFLGFDHILLLIAHAPKQSISPNIVNYNFFLYLLLYPTKGTSKYEGNVYVFNQPVCDDGWSGNDARVICRSLGCSSDTIAVPFQQSKFGIQSSVNFILDNVNCRGYESHIGACDYLTVANCGANEIAGVRCIDPRKLELKGGLSSLSIILSRQVFHTKISFLLCSINEAKSYINQVDDACGLQIF